MLALVSSEFAHFISADRLNKKMIRRTDQLLDRGTTLCVAYLFFCFFFFFFFFFWQVPRNTSKNFWTIEFSIFCSTKPLQSGEGLFFYATKRPESIVQPPLFSPFRPAGLVFPTATWRRLALYGKRTTAMILIDHSIAMIFFFQVSGFSSQVK